MSEPVKQEDNKEGPPPEPTSQQPPPQTDELIPEQEQIGEGDQAKPKEETKQAEKDEELSEDVKDEYSERLDSNRHRNLDYDDKRDRIAERKRDREDFEDDDSDDLNRDLDKNDKAKRNNARSEDGLGKTAEETKQIAKDRTQDKEVMQEAQRILQRQNEALQEVDMVTIVRTRNVIFLFILII